MSLLGVSSFCRLRSCILPAPLPPKHTQFIAFSLPVRCLWSLQPWLSSLGKKKALLAWYYAVHAISTAVNRIYNTQLSMGYWILLFTDYYCSAGRRALIDFPGSWHVVSVPKLAEVKTIGKFSPKCFGGIMVGKQWHVEMSPLLDQLKDEMLSFLKSKEHMQKMNTFKMWKIYIWTMYCSQKKQWTLPDGHRVISTSSLVS